MTAGTEMTSADWSMCLGKEAAECAAPCAYNLGMDLTPPEKEYCAPLYLTDNVDFIMSCVSANNSDACKSVPS